MCFKKDFYAVVPNGKGGHMTSYIKGTESPKEMGSENVKNQIINLMLLRLVSFLVISTVLLAQNSQVCKIDEESVPGWICNTKPIPESVTVVGYGNSYIEAVSVALVEIEFTYDSDLGETFKRTDDRKTDYDSIHRLSRTMYGKNIEIRAKYMKSTDIEEHIVKSRSTEVSKLTIGIDQKDNKSLILTAFRHSTYNKNTLDVPVVKVNYRKSLVGNNDLNIIQELEKAGITILKMYTTKKLKQYVLLQVKKDVIDRNMYDKELWEQFKKKKSLQTLDKDGMKNNLPDEELWQLFQKTKSSQYLDKGFP